MKKKLIKKPGKRAGKDEPRTLQAPSHRLMRERIESSIAYGEIRYYFYLHCFEYIWWNKKVHDVQFEVLEISGYFYLLLQIKYGNFN